MNWILLDYIGRFCEVYDLTKDGLFDTKTGRLCIPSSRSVREMLLHEHHDREKHFGGYKTREKLAHSYFWPNMARDVESYIKSCSQCIRNKVSVGLGGVHWI